MAIFVCQLLSNLYQPIQVFRYDQKLKTIYIQAGVRDEIAIIIDEMKMEFGSLFNDTKLKRNDNY
ncbi:hypothetical protein ACE1B6_28210 [Aerosakkonemataceae cyanobacterium BLCC-F154]|uniref:DUF6888 domain-containing protein n=1 Tax=Floridaenema fluviatile BLCC-F154 TaxID=3153640 RepID=A0ABV4YKD7_9CYAN